MSMIFTDITRANERIKTLEDQLANKEGREANANGILTWLRTRFGENTDTPSNTLSLPAMKAGEYDDEKKDDDDEKDDDEEMKSKVIKLEKTVASLQSSLKARENDTYKLGKLSEDVDRLGAQVRLLTERLSGDAEPKASVETGAPAGGLEAQLRAHQQIQAGMPDWRERQEYGQKNIVPLQKKLGKLQA